MTFDFFQRAYLAVLKLRGGLVQVNDTMQQTIPIGFSINRELLKILDTKRGRIPRSTYVCDLLREHFGIPLKLTY
ncbi:hypothetical protein MNV_180004 [Candidatus Methanoperedens nitroreducens]|uniref:Uncharacterized protein n=1 Tax=Candidatus Methanoperedens nitratireducens TaxID=1392998 RepID=A0A284VMA0_9EURY|nr:hypothetical protein MNV_180004 [Candidatus Methanoperedens nitroreducens]